MKIGFSFGRCINDILNGIVPYDDVLLIVSRTKIEKIDQVRPVVDHYIWENYICGDLDGATAIGERLFNEAKLHQPRCMGVQVPSVPGDAIWLNLAPATDLMDDHVKAAWNQFKVLERLTLDKKPSLPAHINQGIYRKIDNDSDKPNLKDDF